MIIPDDINFPKFIEDLHKEIKNPYLNNKCTQIAMKVFIQVGYPAINNLTHLIRKVNKDFPRFAAKVTNGDFKFSKNHDESTKNHDNFIKTDDFKDYISEFKELIKNKKEFNDISNPSHAIRRIAATTIEQFNKCETQEEKIKCLIKWNQEVGTYVVLATEVSKDEGQSIYVAAIIASLLVADEPKLLTDIADIAKNTIFNEKWNLEEEDELHYKTTQAVTSFSDAVHTITQGSIK